jgi:hypothetical protein
VANVRPLNGCVIRRAVAAGALAYGDVVYITSATTYDLPTVDKIAGGALATSNPYGIVVSTNNPGATSIAAAGEVVDVVVFGPVTGYSGMTPGASIWASDTAGRLSSVVGTHSGFVGTAETAVTVFVRPGLYVIST